MKPLTLDIWLYVLVAYALVSLTMFLVSRFSPYEWHNPYPCVADPTVIRNQFSLGNSFWFTVGTLMQQGSDLNPKVFPHPLFPNAFHGEVVSIDLFTEFQYRLHRRA